jgi:hypothetical protein
MNKLTQLMLTAILVLVAGCARAGASLLVDDASLTPPDQCQIESWGREYTVGSELTTVPACTQSGTEYSLGLSRFTRAADGVVLSPGIKRNFRDIDGHAWGWALSFGSSWSSRPGRLNNWSLNAPVTISLDAAHRMLLHVNLGCGKPPGARVGLSGGVGLELAVTKKGSLLAEAYRDRSGPYAELGWRYSIGERVGLDLLFGHEGGPHVADWITIGMNLALP